MSLIDILEPALRAYSDATSGQTPVEQAIDRVHPDPRVRLAMRIGAGLEGGNLVGGWAAGDNGTSFGPWQIHLPAHPDVTRVQAEDPMTAAQVMAPAYAAAVDQVPPEMWANDPYNAGVLAAYYAEQPLHMYGSEQQDAAKAQVAAHQGGTSGNAGGGQMGNPPPDKTPVPDGADPFGPSGGGAEGPGVVKGADGNTYIWDGTKFVPAPGIPALAGNGNTVKQYGDHFYVFDDKGHIISDSTVPPSAIDVQNANSSATSAGASVMNAGTSQANSAETARSNRVQEQIDYIGKLVAAQGADDARAQDGKKNLLDALGYITKAAYMPGFEPDGPAAAAGLVKPFEVTGVPFRPELPASQYSGALQDQLAKLQAMAAGGG